MTMISGIPTGNTSTTTDPAMSANVPHFRVARNPDAAEAMPKSLAARKPDARVGWEDNPQLAQGVMRWMNTPLDRWPGLPPEVSPGKESSSEVMALQQNFGCDEDWDVHAQSNGYQSTGGAAFSCKKDMGKTNLEVVGALLAGSLNNEIETIGSYNASDLNTGAPGNSGGVNPYTVTWSAVSGPLATAVPPAPLLLAGAGHAVHPPSIALASVPAMLSIWLACKNRLG